MGRAGQVQNASHSAESLNFSAFQPPSLLLIRGRHALHPSCGDAAARELPTKEPPPNSIDLLHKAYLKGVSTRERAAAALRRFSVTHSMSEGKLPGCGTWLLATLPEASITLQRQ